MDALAARIASVMAELNKALQENKKLKDLFNPEKMVEAMIKAVRAMTVKECPKTLQGTQYKGASNYVGSESPSRHMVLVGHWSQKPPTTTAKTLDM